MARLDRDLLYEVAERLVLSEADAENRLTSEEKLSKFHKLIEFMLVSRGCKRALLSQFSLIDDYCFAAFLNAGFCKGSEGRVRNYVGELGQDKWLLAFLIQNGKFKPKKLDIYHYKYRDGEEDNKKAKDEKKSFMQWFSFPIGLENLSLMASKFVRRLWFNGKQDEKEANDKKEVSSMQWFISLLGLEGGLNLDDYEGPQLLLDEVFLTERLVCLGSLDKILGLDPKRVKLIIFTSWFQCLPALTDFLSLRAVRVQKVSLTFVSSTFECSGDDGCDGDKIKKFSESGGANFKDFPICQWSKLIAYVQSSCVNLKWLRVSLCCSVKSVSMVISLSNVFLQAMQTMKNYVLPSLLRGGLFVEVQFLIMFGGGNLKAKAHKLFKWGVLKEKDGKSVIESVVLLDSRAQLILQVSV